MSSTEIKLPIASINLARLSLPRNQTTSRVYRTKKGLPLHSLPGWEKLPLDQKLPMLRPRNEVIFSMEKIGRVHRTKQTEFDPSSTNEIPEYNPLHDPHLKYFYSNEGNMKRLRENGEITEDNDVICTLKDFNAYRNRLHKSHIHDIVQEFNKKVKENQLRRMVKNAECIKKCEQDLPITALEAHRNESIRQRKQMIEYQRRERFERMLQKTQEKFKVIQAKKTMVKSVLEHSKKLNAMKVQQHLELASDLTRKRFIALKKLLKFKSERFARTVAKAREENIYREDEKKEKAWQRRVQERRQHQKVVQYIVDVTSSKRKEGIMQRQEHFEGQWEKLQCSMQQRMKKERRQLNRKLNPVPQKQKKNMSSPHKKAEARISSCSIHLASLDNLVDNEICDILTATVEMQSDINGILPCAVDDPIWKSARFIINHVIAKFTKDMSGNRKLFYEVQSRVEKFFAEAKQIVVARATQVIASTRKAATTGDICSRVPGEFEFDVRLCKKCVEFNWVPSTIGTSSYALQPNIELRTVERRKPTPPGSLTSFTIPKEEQKDKNVKLSRDEMLFIEHYLIKFKRELIVGVGRKVFRAISSHFEKNFEDVRQELLGVDKTFLAKEVTKAVLSHAIKPLNFDSALYFCTNVISSEILWEFQANLLRPECDFDACHKCRN